MLMIDGLTDPVTGKRRRGRPWKIGNQSPYAMTLCEDNWRPLVVPEDLIDRTCLFCSRDLRPDQRICEHCGALAP